MRATFLDLRRRMKEILRALDRNEEVTILYRGKARAVLKPISDSGDKPPLEENPAFGMWADREDMEDVEGYVRRLRKPRYGDLRQ